MERKEAIEVIKKNYPHCAESGTQFETALRTLIPELKESEDEKIRKTLLETFSNFDADGTFWTDILRMSKDDVIAWLEKQKPIEHFELKEGHWYVCHRAFCCRADHLTIKEGEKFMCEKDGVAKGFIIKDPEKYFKETVPPAPYEDEQ